MTMDETAKPFFPHPIINAPDVHVILDACHDLKNIRNAFDKYSILCDGDGNLIKWKYIKNLAILQQKEGLRLGNKLRAMYVEYKSLIMKVFLAAQTLSASVADAIEFCDQVLRLPQFKDCEATVRFIRCIDCLFDFLNVRNPWRKGFKSPLRQNNEHVWRARVLDELNYLRRLKRHNGQLIFQSQRKTGFIGLYTAVLATIKIYDRYVKPDNSQLSYLLSYKMSQDHLELFFAAIRVRSGWCPNPTVAQFISAFKRLFIRHDVKVAIGNTAIMDDTKILHVTTMNKKVARIERYDLSVYSTVENQQIVEKYDLNCDNNSDVILDELKEYIAFAWSSPNNLSEFPCNVVGYIAGFVVRKLEKNIKCPLCISACHGILSTHQNVDYDQNCATNLMNFLEKQLMPIWANQQ